VGQLALANAEAVEAVMEAPDEEAAMAAAVTGGANVRKAISAAGGSGAYAESAGNAIESRLKVLAGKKRGRAQAAAEALASTAAAAAAAAASRALRVPRLTAQFHPVSRPIFCARGRAWR
jgi:hypothetical protein